MEIIKPAGPFTAALLDAIKPILKNIVSHPFAAELAEGTLSKQCFSHYISQDILYLKYDNLALKKVSEKAFTEQERLFFLKLSKDGLAVEFALQNEFLKHFNIQEAEERSTVIRDYTEFLMFHANTSPYEVASAALLPCFWVYGMVGKEIYRKSVENNIYGKWIETYQSDAFEALIVSFIRIVENLSKKASAKLMKDMKEAFIRATEYELAFYEESHRK